MTRTTTPRDQPDPPPLRGDLRPPGLNADEPTTLLSFLDYLREAVVAKAEGVPDEVAKAPGVTSGTSLLGLVKHLTAVEFNWFVWAYEGADLPLRDDEIPPSDDESGADLIAAYRAAALRSNETVAACADLERPGARSLRETPPPSLRWVLVHMIEETARHAGHADIIRERYDGDVGR
ncbi:DinB family protein [Streptomyces sp. NPDC003300]|uniref:DinB family protein n=1 Tax=unclassified Streptomyces TaxID=2593676 RepID=UPI0033A3E321